MSSSPSSSPGLFAMPLKYRRKSLSEDDDEYYSDSPDPDYLSSPLLPTPLPSSSPPSYARIQSSPTLPFEIGIHDHRNPRVNQSIWALRTRLSSDDLKSPGLFERDSSSVFYATDEEDDEEEEEEVQFRMGDDIRGTYFSVSSERGQWKGDPRCLPVNINSRPRPRSRPVTNPTQIDIEACDSKDGSPVALLNFPDHSSALSSTSSPPSVSLRYPSSPPPTSPIPMSASSPPTSPMSVSHSVLGGTDSLFPSPMSISQPLPEEEDPTAKNATPAEAILSSTQPNVVEVVKKRVLPMSPLPTWTALSLDDITPLSLQDKPGTERQPSPELLETVQVQQPSPPPDPTPPEKKVKQPPPALQVIIPPKKSMGTIKQPLLNSQNRPTGEAEEKKKGGAGVVVGGSLERNINKIKAKKMSGEKSTVVNDEDGTGEGAGSGKGKGKEKGKRKKGNVDGVAEGPKKKKARVVRHEDENPDDGRKEKGEVGKKTKKERTIKTNRTKSKPSNLQNHPTSSPSSPVPSSSKLPFFPPPSPVAPTPTSPLADPLYSEISGMLIESMATSRATSLPASSLCKSILQSRPALKEKRSEGEWIHVIERVLVEGAEGEGKGVFGKVESSGMDDSGQALEAQWFYVPERDEDQERAQLIKSVMPRAGKRNETKKYKRYYWKPLEKISRWDPEDEM